ncbi:MAG: hypothetical protein A2283_12490 [Lentisphaerae bacterium RIFOXYA12_FULL_48_11]|nr:MAG: hypothetical protein A2283_12490 [Lentisphaerae bacterium RIFOXYA12_FULL_48_11]
MQKKKIATALALITLALLNASATFAEETLQEAAIAHIPIPLGVKGKPFPIMAEIKENKSKIKSVKVIVKSSTNLKEARINMVSIGAGRYQAAIPAKNTTATSELVYRIEAETVLGVKSNTPWYPVKLESVEDKVKDVSDTAEKKTPEKLGKIRKFIKQHPIITGVGLAAAIGGGVALASGGGSSGSSSTASGETLTADTGTPDISGTWHYTNIMPSDTISGSMNLTQSGTSVSGNFSEEGDSGSVSGSVNGSSISLTLNFGDGTTDQLSGSVNGNQISGSWHESETGETGTFTATR